MAQYHKEWMKFFSGCTVSVQASTAFRPDRNKKWGGWIVDFFFCLEKKGQEEHETQRKRHDKSQRLTLKIFFPLLTVALCMQTGVLAYLFTRKTLL